MSDEQDLIQGLRAMQRDDEAHDSELLRQVAAGARTADSVEPEALDDDPAVQARLLELSAPVDEAFLADTLARVQRAVAAPAPVEAADAAREAPTAETSTPADASTGTVVSLAAFRRKVTAGVATLAAAAGVIFMVTRGPGDPAGDDPAGEDPTAMLGTVELGYELELVATPRASRDTKAPPTASGAGREGDPLVVAVPTQGTVEWNLRPQKLATKGVDARAFYVEGDTLVPAGDELKVRVAKTGAVRMSLDLARANGVREGAQVELLMVVGDEAAVGDVRDRASANAIGRKAPGTRRFIRLMVD